MEASRLRVALDANVLIAGVRLPRWPYEVLRAALNGYFELVLPAQVIEEARRHLPLPPQAAALTAFLEGSQPEIRPMPALDEVRAQLTLVRSVKDIPIAISLLNGEVDIFVTNDRDFSDPVATEPRFHQHVRVMLPAVFLRQVVGWSPEALEAIRNRRWDDLVDA